MSILGQKACILGPFQLVRKLGKGLSYSLVLFFFSFFAGGFLCQEFLRGHNKEIANDGHELYQIKGGGFEALTG